MASGQINVWLGHCDLAGLACTTQGSTSSAQWTGGVVDWVPKTVDLGWIDYATVPAGRVLSLEPVVGTASDDALWLAYNTTSYPSILSVQP